MDEKEIKQLEKAVEKAEKNYKKNSTKANQHTLDMLKKQLSEAKDEKPVETSSTSSSTSSTKAPSKNVTSKAPTSSSTTSTTRSTEKGLEKVEIKAQETADELNNDELATKKTEDAKSAAETAKNRAAQIDDNREENVPTWVWREAQEMAPTSKAKRGFLIANYFANRLGTALHNVGVAFQNNGGSGGGQMKEHGGSYIDQYRQNKLEQVLANRKAKQNSLLQQQIDALVAIGVSENEARAIQNRLRNSSFWNKYNRLTNEQQVYIQGLLYNDTKGKINDAALGNFIDQLMEGKNVSLEQAAVNMMAAEGIDNIDEIKSGAKAIGDKVIKWLNWDKPGQ